MDYTFEHSLIHGCLLIRIGGKWPSKNPEDIMIRVFSIWKQNQKPLLMDIRDMEDSPSILGDYLGVERLADAGFRQLGRIAVLDNQERHDADDFFETTALTRGLQFRFFYADEKEAIAWLTHQKGN